MAGCRVVAESTYSRSPLCFSRPVKSALRATFVLVNNLYCLPTYILWMLALRPLRTLLADLYWKIEGLLFHWLLAMVSAWSWSAGYEIVESGDEMALCCGERTLVLANHQSTADVPMLMATWNPRPGLLPNLMWIMDRVFMFTNFGVVSVLHEDFFIQSGRNNRDSSLELLKLHLHKSYIPRGRKFMVLFPEGGFLHKRREASQRFAKKNNLPLLEYVSLPRAGALKVIMDEIGPYAERTVDGQPTSSKQRNKEIFNQETGERQVPKNANNWTQDKDRLKWVLDATIAYENREPLDLSSVVYGHRPPCTTHIYYRLYPATEIPTDHEEMTQWLYDRFIEKEKMLEEFYRTGKFPSKGPDQVERDGTLRPVRQDTLRFIIVHLFFIFSTLIHIKMIYSIYHVCSPYIPW